VLLHPARCVWGQLQAYGSATLLVYRTKVSEKTVLLYGLTIGNFCGRGVLTVVLRLGTAVP
jgi:hypothetical protein